ncbi:MAG TPA: hypothetical protein VFS20_20970 [Longimicrobium sp.]|nr:hypothetical protein [Longimicrobium sp.]
MTQSDAAAERARFREAVDRLRLSTGYSMDDVAVAFGVSLNLVQRWRAEGGRHRPRPGWERTLAEMARAGAAANRERADAADALAIELEDQ